ncbi:MAG: succinate dehydrogenase cytochrome b subunit [Methylococcales bacterium]|jgi:succinate dehydrogenase / fumarate reductase, cytochrome b subunit|nr:succinate dehydrogenase cytochrome b subunit [Methylococcales bacterium]
MFRLIRLFNTSIGSKLMTATTGLVLVLFIAGHLVGNLLIFQQPSVINNYAAWLQENPLLWVIRGSMLFVFLFHAFLGLRLARQNRQARESQYHCKTPIEGNISSRFMLISGGVLFAFVVFHVLHLTVGVVDGVNANLVNEKNQVDVYSRVILGFQNPWISGAYLVALGLLGVHLFHAIQSLFQTFGFHHESYLAFIRVFSIGLSMILTLGLASIPLSVLFGFLTVSTGSGG